VVKKKPREAGGGEDEYCVEDAAGQKTWERRSHLRQRVFVKQCHAGVTGDKKHDRLEVRFAISILFVIIV